MRSLCEWAKSMSLGARRWMLRASGCVHCTSYDAIKLGACRRSCHGALEFDLDQSSPIENWVQSRQLSLSEGVVA